MKKNVLFLIFILISSFSFSQVSTTNINKQLIPQKIDYDGMPELTYTVNNNIIALDSYSDTDNEGKYIRMKFNNKEVKLRMQKNNTSKTKRVYSNNDFTVTFYDIIYGTCAGEGAQNLSGKLLIESSSKQIILNFKGSDTMYSSKKCQDIGNG
jgi:hypothetical protein